MEIITFALKPLIGKMADIIAGSVFKKMYTKHKLNKIKDFKKKYEDTFVDSNAFQQFLNNEENAYLIFNYIFGAEFRNQSKEDFIEHLSELAIREINSYRRNAQLQDILDNPIVNSYLEELVNYLETIRDSKFRTGEMSLIANIQSSIIESDDRLKKYLESNLYEMDQKAHFKKYNDKYLGELLDRNIRDLGKRYNAAANVETKYKHIFKSIVADSSLYNEFDIKFQYLINSITELEILVKEHISKLNIKVNFIDDILLLLNSSDYNSKDFYSNNEFSDLLSKLKKFISELYDLRHKLYQEELADIREGILKKVNIVLKINGEIDEYINLIQPYLIKEPFLLIYGDGGIGKSHLLADNAKELENKGHTVLLFLGQHLNTQEPPLNQMFNLIDFKGSKDYFFHEMNNRASRKNRKMLLIIDALNEGAGKYLWRSYLLSFLNYIKGFENISVVLSVRSNFIRSVLPENIDDDFPLHRIEHQGFQELTLEALEPFFNFYKIDPIVFPSMESECYNPLFLQIYCETFDQKYDGYKGWSIVEVLEKYIEKVNKRLSIDQRFEFSSSINLVDKILKALAKEFIDSETQFIEIEHISEILRAVACPFTTGYRELLLGLEEESILSVNKGSGIVYFTYERFSDIYISLNLSDRYKENPEIIKEIISSDNYFYDGINESLTIVFADKLNVEFLEIIDDNLITLNLAESFIRGLSWRNIKKINNLTIKWIKVCLNQEDLDLIGLTYERLLKQSIIKDSPLNVHFLNELLSEMPMFIRDGSWTIAVNNNIEVPKKLVEIVLKENLSYKNFKYDNFMLLSNTLIWLFVSTDKTIRDISTNALIRILLREPSIMLDSIKRFIEVNDPYILERLLASIYGTVVRLESLSEIKEIVNIIYKDIFDKEEVYPNILVRDYARGIILFFIEKGVINLEDYIKINPPYSSEWYKDSYTVQDIDKKLNEIKQQMNLQYCGFDYIVNSMTTEYGRGTGGYGDFGRYVFGSSLNDWKNQFNDQDLSNIATMRIIEYGYDEKTHGHYDRNLRNYNRHENNVERIGKKYQWLVLYELLAKLTDNFPVYKEVRLYTPEYEQYIETESHRMLLSFRRLQDQPNTDIELQTESLALKEEDHFLGTEKEYYKNYSGPWDPFIRNYDPTLLEYPPEKRPDNLVSNLLPYRSSKSWAQSKEEFTRLHDFIFIEHEGEKYISLAQFDLKQTSEGIWKDKEGLLVAFDAQYMGYETNLLIKLDFLNEFLSKHNLELIWECYMEKWSDRSRKEEWFICWLEDQKVQFNILDEYSNNNVKDR